MEVKTKATADPPTAPAMTDVDLSDFPSSAGAISKSENNRLVKRHILSNKTLNIGVNI